MSINGLNNPKSSTDCKDCSHSQIEDSQLEFDDSASETIRSYTCKIISSIKESLCHCINTENIAISSLLDLSAQNEQINRIKNDLNKSHDTVSITEKLVDRYVSALNWLSSTINWNNSVKLDIKDSDDKLDSIVRSFSQDDDTEDNCPDESYSSTEPENQFFSQATNGLNNLLNNMKRNRVKTDLLSSIIVHQNNELEKISSSAQSLKDRVSGMNKVLKKQT